MAKYIKQPTEYGETGGESPMNRPTMATRVDNLESWRVETVVELETKNQEIHELTERICRIERDLGII